MAALAGGHNLTVPFLSGRGDTSQEHTDAASFDVLKPDQDAFRNQNNANPYKMVDKAHMLNLTAVEMTCLIGGLRVMGGNCKEAGDKGVFTDKPGTLTNDFFTNLVDMTYEWVPEGDHYVGKNRRTGAKKWSASLCDLTFGSNSELRNICETYACEDASHDFVNAFAKAWAKADVNAIEEDGWTPLHFAARECTLQVCQLLLQSRADITLMNSERLTPVDVAWQEDSKFAKSVVMLCAAESN